MPNTYLAAVNQEDVIDGDTPRVQPHAPWWWFPMTWLGRQETNTVLMVLMMVGIGWVIYYSMTTAVPAHLKTIQDGYDRNTAQMTAALDRNSAAMEKALDKQNDAFAANLKYIVDSFREMERERERGSP